MSADLDQDACMDVLKPHFQRLSDCIYRGFNRYQEYPPHLKADHDDRAAAGCVYSHIITLVEEAFFDIRGAALLDARGLKILNIEDRLVGRFKKVDEEGRSRSYPTQQTRHYDRQLPLPYIPPAATRLTFGYEPDPAFSSVVRVIVSCPLGRNILWSSQIVIGHDIVNWVDITPKRLPGTEPFRRYGEGRQSVEDE